MKKIVTTTLLLASFFAFSQSKTIDQKVDALLKQMTLEEKIGQLNQYNDDSKPPVQLRLTMTKPVKFVMDKWARC